jgi:hypothetical protein
MLKHIFTSKQSNSMKQSPSSGANTASPDVSGTSGSKRLLNIAIFYIKMLYQMSILVYPAISRTNQII